MPLTNKLTFFSVFFVPTSGHDLYAKSDAMNLQHIYSLQIVSLAFSAGIFLLQDLLVTNLCLTVTLLSHYY